MPWPMRTSRNVDQNLIIRLLPKMRDDFALFLRTPREDGQIDSPAGYRLRLVKQGTPRFVIQLRGVHFDKSIRGRGLFTAFLDHVEDHPGVDQVIAADLMNDCLHRSLIRRGYFSTGKHCYFRWDKQVGPQSVRQRARNRLLHLRKRTRTWASRVRPPPG